MKIKLIKGLKYELLFRENEGKMVKRVPVSEHELDLFIYGIGEKLSILTGMPNYSIDSKAKEYQREEYRFPLYWDIVSAGKDLWYIREFYHYSGDSLDHIGPGGISSVTYGEFTLWDLATSYYSDILNDYCRKPIPSEIV